MTSLRPLTPALTLIAENELNESKDRLPEDLRALKDWIGKQPHLKARTDDQFLVAFLRGCKYSLEKAKTKLDSFYTMRGAIPELYNNRTLDNLKTLDILRTGCLLRLPAPLGEGGPRINISRYGQYDPSRYNIAEVIKVGTMIGEIQMQEDDNCIVSGFVEIIDLSNISSGHFFQFDPVFIKKLAVLGDKALPYRPKGFHFVNCPKGTEKILSISKSLMSDKIKQRFHIHSNYESLLEHIPKQYLPKEYGGNNGVIQDVVDHWEKKLLSYRDYFEEEKQYGTNEKLRPGKPVNTQSLFGIEGSFRKLEVD